MRLTFTQLTRCYYLFSLLILTVAACMNMRSLEGVETTGLERYVNALTFMLWGASALKLLIFSDYRFYRPSPLILCYCAFFVWTIIPTLMEGNYDTTSLLILDLIWITLPLLALIVSYNTVRNYGTSAWDVRMFCIMTLMLFAQYVLVFRELNIFLAHSHLIVSYYMLYMLPLVFLSKSKTARTVLTLIVTIAIVSSVKRAGFVALVAALLAYLVCWMFVAKKLKPTTILLGLIGLAAFGGLVYMAGVADEDNNVFERFETVGDDNGSNRVLVWQTTVAMIEKSDVGSFITGHGYYSVEANSPIGFSAHNDFLEVTYDYGLVGIILYATSWLMLIAYLLRMMWNKSELAPPLAMLMTMYLVLSLISHVIIYFFANIVMLTIGYIAAKYEQQLCSEQTESY